MNIQKALTALDISASGMRAQRRRMNAVASNIANIETTKTENGEPYRRRVVVMQAGPSERTFAQILNREDERIKISNPRHIQSVRSYNDDDGIGVPVQGELQDVQDNAFRTMYDPDHPDSDADGYVRMPNINVVTEMVNMITASRSYEANATVIDASKSMSKKALEI
jgi:flagellar basal-body rod protein FlgC